MQDITLIYCPYPTVDTARSTAATLLSERLVACCNILPSGESHYWWEGALTSNTETIMFCKTTTALANAATEAIRSSHPYECPAILHLPAQATPSFAHWVAAETADQQQS